MAASSSGTRFSRLSMSSRNAVASASSAAVSAPERLPWPISFASALRRACFSCKAVWAARRSASRTISSAATGASPRRAMRGVEGGGIGSDGADIVHGLRPRLASVRPSGRLMMEISYSAISGRARPDWVMTSGGARIAAMMNIPTYA